MDRTRAVILTAILVASAAGLAGCLGGGSDKPQLTQTGSSTVLPLAQAWAQEFDGADISVGGGGSSHGRNALLTGNADIGDASSKIGPGDYEKVGCDVSRSEIEAAQEGDHPWTYPECNGVEPTEFVVAWDVLTVVVHPDNDWLGDGLNKTQLKAIFTTEGTAETWDEVPGLEDAPNEEIEIHAPDAASGTFEFFFEWLAGDTDKSLLAAGNQRYHGSADDNTILTKISQNEHAVGFFGLYYYDANSEAVDAVPIDGDGDGTHVEPSFETASEYPITRPLHLYVDGIPTNETRTSQALRDYLRYVFSEEGQSVVPDVGYVKESDFEPQEFAAQQAVLE